MLHKVTFISYFTITSHSQSVEYVSLDKDFALKKNYENATTFTGPDGILYLMQNLYSYTLKIRALV